MIHLAVDENFLRYFMTYPGVQEEGVLVAERNGEVVGFEIISTHEQKHMHAGKIILFAAEDIDGAQRLLSEAEEYCLEKGVDLLMAVPPPQLASAFRQGNWDRYIHSSLVARGVRLVPLLQAILDTGKEQRRLRGTRNFILALEDEAIQVANQNNRWIVERIDQAPEGVPTLTTETKTLLNILFGNNNPFLEYLKRNIKIKSFQQGFSILRFLRNIRLKIPIFTSLADKI